MSKETVAATDSGAAATAAERVCQQLFHFTSKLISPVGSQAILSRALHLTGRTFPFLNGVSAGRPPAEAYLGGLRGSLSTIDEGAAGEALRAVLCTVLGLLVDFIGEDLTFRLVRETWLDLPIREPGRRVTPNGHKATT